MPTRVGQLSRLSKLQEIEVYLANQLWKLGHLWEDVLIYAPDRMATLYIVDTKMALPWDGRRKMTEMYYARVIRVSLS